MKLGKNIALLILFPMMGTVAFMLVEKWSFLDSLYMAIITLTTVGYGETHPLSAAGRVVVIIYIILGMGVFLYSLSQLGEFIIHSQMSDLLGIGKKNMENKIKKLEHHFIICGFGKMGESLCESLGESNKSFIVIESHAERAHLAQEKGYITIEDDCTNDDILKKANIKSAQGLVCVLSTDADNLYVVMSSRLMHKDLMIVSRASNDKNYTKLMKAGANRVISPHKTGANKIASLLSNPKVDDFMEIFSSGDIAVDLVHITVKEKDEYTNRTLSETSFSKQGIMIVGIKKSNGKLKLPPTHDTLIEANDILFAIGRSESLQQLLYTNHVN